MRKNQGNQPENRGEGMLEKPGDVRRLYFDAVRLDSSRLDRIERRERIRRAWRHAGSSAFGEVGGFLKNICRGSGYDAALDVARTVSHFENPYNIEKQEEIVKILALISNLTPQFLPGMTRDIGRLDAEGMSTAALFMGHDALAFLFFTRNDPRVLIQGDPEALKDVAGEVLNAGLPSPIPEIFATLTHCIENNSVETASKLINETFGGRTADEIIADLKRKST